MLKGITDPWAGWSNVDEGYARISRGERPSCAGIRADAPRALVSLMKRGWDQVPSKRPVASAFVAVLG